MAYIVTQTEGKFRDADRQMQEARMAGKYDEMLAIYRRATGDTSPIRGSEGAEWDSVNKCWVPSLPSLTSGWWIFNAGRVIRSPRPADYAEVRYNGTDEKYANILAGVCQAKHGGKWQVRWE